jgi:hypothetical protein
LRSRMGLRLGAPPDTDIMGPTAIRVVRSLLLFFISGAFCQCARTAEFARHLTYEPTSNARARHNHTTEENYTIAFVGWPFILWENALISVLEKCIIVSGKPTK